MCWRKECSCDLLNAAQANTEVLRLLQGGQTKEKKNFVSGKDQSFTHPLKYILHSMEYIS